VMAFGARPRGWTRWLDARAQGRIYIEWGPKRYQVRGPSPALDGRLAKLQKIH
jgi:hypothetical protein